MAGYQESPEREANPLTIQDMGLSYVTDDDDDDDPVQEDPTSGWTDSEGLPTKHTEIHLNGTPGGADRSTPEVADPSVDANLYLTHIIPDE